MAESTSWLASGTTKAVLGIVGAGALAIVIANKTSLGSSSNAPKKERRPPTVLASLKATSGTGVASASCTAGVGPMFGDAQNLYFNACDGIHRIDKKNNDSTLIYKGSHPQLAMDDTHLYLPGDRNILAIAKARGHATSTIDPAPCKSDLAIDSDFIYCIARSATEDGILRIPKISRTTGAAAATSVIKTAPPSSLSALAIDGAHVYFALTTTSQPVTLQIVRMPKSGGESEVVIAKRDAEHPEVPIANPRSLTIMGDSVYWVNWCNGCPIASANKSGGGEAIKHTSVENRTFEAFVAYDGELYATSSDGQLTRVSASTTKNQFPSPLEHADALQNKAPRALHVDEAHIYWARPHEQKFMIERLDR